MHFITRSKMHTYQHQHDQVLRYVRDWNGEVAADDGNASPIDYHEKANYLKAWIGSGSQHRNSENMAEYDLKQAIALNKKYPDDFRDIYPYAPELIAEEPFQSISFYEQDIGNFVRDSDQENFLFEEADSRLFNVTVDIAYTFHKAGSNEHVTKMVPRIPIFRKLYYDNKKVENEDDRINEHECKLYYRGYYSMATDECIYYM